MKHSEFTSSPSDFYERQLPEASKEASKLLKMLHLDA